MKIGHSSVGGQWVRTLVARMDTGVVFYEATQRDVGGQWFISGCLSEYGSGDQ